MTNESGFSRLTARINKAFERVNKAVYLKQQRETVTAERHAAQAPKPKQASLKQQAQDIYRMMITASDADKPEAARLLLRFKKSAKVSWDSLGFGAIPGIEANIQTALNARPSKPTQAPVMPAKINTSGDRLKQAKELLAIYADHANSNDDRKAAAKELVALKRASKVSWTRLGIRDVDALTVTAFTKS